MYDLSLCRGCLSVDGELFHIFGTGLNELYSATLGLQVSPDDGLPQYLCYLCKHLLFKYNGFRCHCLHINNIMENAKRNYQIFPEYLTTFHRMVLPLSNSETKYESIQPDVAEITFENKVKEENYKKEIDIKIETYVEDENDLANSRKVKRKIIPTESIFSEDCNVDDFISEDFEDSCSSEVKPQKFKVLSIKKIKRCTKPLVLSNTVKVSRRSAFENMLGSGVYKVTKIKRDLEQPDEIKRMFENRTKRGTFESKEHIEYFESTYNVEVSILNKEQQIQEIEDRRNSENYKSSPFQCVQCYRGFIEEAQYQKHMRLQHDPIIGDIVCEICNFRYKDKRNLNHHMRFHRLKFTCKECKQVSRSSSQAKEHFKIHVGFTNKCKYCGKTYNKLTSYLTHLKTIHIEQFSSCCELCGDPVSGPAGLNMHKKRSHKDVVYTSKCATCGTKFLNPEALAHHTSVNYGFSCKSVISCPYCGDKYYDNLKLKEHLLEMHINKNNIYACVKCNKTFNSSSILNSHYKRIHTDKKNNYKTHICDKCGKELLTATTLKYHMRSHTGERPYCCLHCDKTFSDPRMLTAHKAVHSSDRPYDCKLCPKTFKRRSALRLHVQIKHEGMKYKPRLKKQDSF